MASIRKHGKGYRAEIARKGIRRSKVFPTRQEAKDWAARQEYLILNREKVAAAQSFGDVMARYAREVSPSRRGHRWELIRLEKLQRDQLADVRMGDLEAANAAPARPTADRGRIAAACACGGVGSDPRDRAGLSRFPVLWGDRHAGGGDCRPVVGEDRP